MAEDCDFPGWLAQLEQFRSSEIEIFVPGHGMPGGKAGLELEQRFILAMQDLVANAIANGKSLKEILALPLPAPFAAWEAFASRNQNNFRTLYAKLAGGK